mgnify:CR=1 FL=1
MSPQFWIQPNRQLDPLVNFMILFLDRSEYIKNPYIRAKFIEIMHGWTQKSSEHLLDLYQELVDQLSTKLMNFYIEVERTGASSQFYDKFNIRFHISQIIKCIWDHPIHRKRLKDTSCNRRSFIQFINFLLNDTSFLLDEAMMKLTEIRKFQIDQASGIIEGLSGEEKKARLEANITNERQCTAYGQLGGETLNMLSYITKEIKEPFLQDEVIDHLAAMLNYNLVHLAGPKCRELKVENPEKFFFRPRVWLGCLIQVFLNFLDYRSFLEALARDGRSFQPDTFRKASALIGKLGLGSEAEIITFNNMIDQVIGIQASAAIEEEDLGEIPEEFLDPLMATLMEDPVLLTTSGNTVDRKTIISHLLNHQIDPFNRMPITIEQVIPNTELKERIDKFLGEKRRK